MINNKGMQIKHIKRSDGREMYFLDTKEISQSTYEVFKRIVGGLSYQEDKDLKNIKELIDKINDQIISLNNENQNNRLKRIKDNEDILRELKQLLDFIYEKFNIYITDLKISDLETFMNNIEVEIKIDNPNKNEINLILPFNIGESEDAIKEKGSSLYKQITEHQNFDNIIEFINKRLEKKIKIADIMSLDKSSILDILNDIKQSE